MRAWISCGLIRFDTKDTKDAKDTKAALRCR
jgi:hypothetical protein